MDAPATRRILIVGDDPDTGQMLSLLVAAFHPAAWIRVASDGAEAVKVARTWHPEVVITDIDMPVLSGLEAALEIRGFGAEHTPYLIATTGDRTWLTDSIALVVFDRIVIKPVSMDILRVVF